MKVLLPTVLLSLCLASASAAQEQISPEAFLDIAEGKTLTFSRFDDGSLVGIEEFLSRQHSVWVQADGTCMYGRIWTRDQQLCFTYDLMPERPQCWYMFKDGDRLLAMYSNLDSIQEVTAITEETLGCPSAPTAGIGKNAPAG